MSGNSGGRLHVDLAGHGSREEASEGCSRAAPRPLRKAGLSDEQKDGMYKVYDEYKSQIDELSAQIKKLQADRDAKLQEKLTPTQKTRLQELRDEAAKKAAATKAKTDAKSTEAKPAETKKP